jgi:hypothetical protein
LVWAYPADDVSSCTITDFTGLAEQPPAWITIDDVIDQRLAWMKEDSAWRGFEGSIMGLHAGRTGRIHATDEGGWAYSSYDFSDGDAWFSLQCWSPEPPDDRWLSIAGSFEFVVADEIVPPAPGPTDVVVGRRTERPEDGFALTFPGGWTAEDLTAEDHERMFAHIEPQERVFQRSLLRADAFHTDDYCFIVDATRLAEAEGWDSIEEATEWFGAGFEGSPDYSATTATFVDIPAGPTGHITSVYDSGWHYGGYYLSDGDDWFYLGCWSPEPAAGRWLSIAETFEFLPV